MTPGIDHARLRARVDAYAASLRARRAATRATLRTLPAQASLWGEA